MAIKYILGIQSYANHDSAASIVKFNTNLNWCLELISTQTPRIMMFIDLNF